METQLGENGQIKELQEIGSSSREAHSEQARKQGRRATLIYALMQIFFWCSYSIAWSYTAVFLVGRGYDNSMVGVVTGVGAVLSILLQPLLAAGIQYVSWMNTRNNMLLLRAMSMLAAVLILLRLPGWLTLPLLFTVLTLADASIPSILNCLAMEGINAGIEINFGLARSMGSLSFALLSVIIGFVIARFGTGSLMWLYLLVGLGLLAVSCFFPAEFEAAEPSAEKSRLSVMLREYPFFKYFLLSAALLFMGHNMLNVFLINLIERAGGDSTNLGVALALAAVFELPAMIGFVRIARRYEMDSLLLVSAGFFLLKTLVALLAVRVELVYLEQCLQCGAFALFTPASVFYINLRFKPRDRAVGQALLGSFSMGMGGTLGNLLGGIILDCSNVVVMCLAAVLLSVLGFALMLPACGRRLRGEITPEPG